MKQPMAERQGLLKRALTSNAVFSVLSGVVILSANRWLVNFLGLPDKVSLAILGISLIVFATLLWLNARRPKIKITDCAYRKLRLAFKGLLHLSSNNVTCPCPPKTPT